MFRWKKGESYEDSSVLLHVPTLLEEEVENRILNIPHAQDRYHHRALDPLGL